MVRCTFLVGMIEMDAAAGASFGLVCCRSNRFSRDVWREDFAGGADYPALIADLVQLRAELDGEFRRLQARLAV
jgi:hypothetical protein